MFAYESNPKTRRYEQVAPPTEEEIRCYLADSQAWAASPEQPRTRYRLAITIRPASAGRVRGPEDSACGRISLILNWPEIREWEVGWTVDPRFWGRGYATEAAWAVLGFAFGELGAHRVVAFCNANNRASARVMEKLGMQRDGYLRQTRWWNGAWADELVYSILDHEWQGSKT
jgi:ribosomal-protein-alanine N-acetyltransferase